MTDGEAILRAIRADPADDTLRLVYADYLEESGEDEARARLIRTQIRLAGYGECAMEAGCPCCDGRRREFALLRDHGKRWLEDPDGFGLGEAEMSLTGGGGKEGVAFSIRLRDGSHMRIGWRAGFPHSVFCPMGSWIDHGVTAVGLFPLGQMLTSGPPCVPYVSFDGHSWRIGDEMLRPHHIPEAVFARLSGGKRDGPSWLDYESEGEAQEALSDACLRWARGEK